ncbi:MAG TPA: aromatic ring-hydroxylating dioxygenase subunit alpha [Steroidobacteraceae bacterium]|nr:aromatic ring-hydroxylating dioxygenase subunit alpha [Steroidobacteraceae bacterium]
MSTVPVPPGSVDLQALIARQRPGHSLEQPFYTAPEIFEVERRGWLARQWFVLGHGSEIPEAGCYMVRELLGESLIVLRDESGRVHAYYNVCRHRGSRLYTEDGRGTHLVCPYHAWGYRLDGSLRSAAALPAGTDRAALGLRSIAVSECEGLIVASLTGEVETARTLERTFADGLRHHGIAGARVAARRSYPTRGNWKLVIENFIECYHCLPAHPEYCRVMKHVDAVAREPNPAGQAWQQRVDAWLEREANRESPLGGRPAPLTLPLCGTSRAPIGGGRKTQSEDGQPVAPLMGRQARFDGGVSIFRCEPFIYFGALNDHAVMFQFLPVSVDLTQVTISWLVEGAAGDAEIDVERMIWLWDVTTIQDQQLIERNAEGIRSRSYLPGPYSELESMPSRLVQRYLSELAADGASAR